MLKPLGVRFLLLLFDMLNGLTSEPLALRARIDEGLTEAFFDQLSIVSRMKPYMVGPGNHEGKNDALSHLPAHLNPRRLLTYSSIPPQKADCNEDTTKQSLCPIGQTNFTGYINRFANIMPTASSASIFDRDLSSLSGGNERVGDYNDIDITRVVEERTARRRGPTRASSSGTNRADAPKSKKDLSKRSAASLANPPFWYSFGAS